MWGDRSRRRESSMKRPGAFLLGLSMALGMFAVFSTGAWAAPSPISVQGNPSCISLGYESGFKVDPPNSGTYTVFGSQTVTVTSDGTSFSWSSSFGIDAVISKGGPKANVYVYDPPSESTGDSGLHSPINPKTNQPYGLSHIEFCYDRAPTTPPDTPPTTTPPPDEIAVEIVKTNDADGDGTYTNSEEALEPGSTVSFHLVITNTSDEVVTITSLTDAFPGSSIDLLANKCSALAGVSLDPGESVDCTFSIQNYSPDATAGAKINTATVCVENANGTQEACDDNDSRVTSAEVLGETVTRSPTRTPPAGLAFTGPDDGSTNWIIVAFLLLLIGTTLMYFGSPPEEELEG